LTRQNKTGRLKNNRIALAFASNRTGAIHAGDLEFSKQFLATAQSAAEERGGIIGGDDVPHE